MLISVGSQTITKLFLCGRGGETDTEGQTERERERERERATERHRERQREGVLFILLLSATSYRLCVRISCKRPKAMITKTLLGTLARRDQLANCAIFATKLHPKENSAREDHIAWISLSAQRARFLE